MAINGGCVYVDTQKLGTIKSDAVLTSPAALKIVDQVKWAFDHNKQIVCNGFWIIKGTDATAYNKGIRAIFSLDPENKYMKITIQG